MEGPSLVILAEETRSFVGKQILKVSGSTKTIDISALRHATLRDVRTWGKHFLLSFGEITVRIHFLMFGSYRINERKDTPPRLLMVFPNGEISFYSCSIAYLTKPLETIYDWRIDVMSSVWNEQYVLKRLRQHGKELLCDVLLDQEIFAGVGNIIKNEVLFRLGLKPETKVDALSAEKQRALVREVREYCGLFYRWKKEFVLKKNWQIYRRKFCPVCGTKVVMEKGCERERINYFCPYCQNNKPRRRALADNAVSDR